MSITNEECKLKIDWHGNTMFDTNTKYIKQNIKMRKKIKNKIASWKLNFCTPSPSLLILIITLPLNLRIKINSVLHTSLHTSSIVSSDTLLTIPGSSFLINKIILHVLLRPKSSKGIALKRPLKVLISSKRKLRSKIGVVHIHLWWQELGTMECFDEITVWKTPQMCREKLTKKTRKKIVKLSFTFNKMLIINILRRFSRQQDPKKLGIYWRIIIIGEKRWNKSSYSHIEGSMKWCKWKKIRRWVITSIRCLGLWTWWRTVSQIRW